jgi:hypothetical protein
LKKSRKAFPFVLSLSKYERKALIFRVRRSRFDRGLVSALSANGVFQHLTQARITKNRKAL